MWANLPETILVPRVHLPIMRIITEDAHQIKIKLCFSLTTPCHLETEAVFLSCPQDGSSLHSLGGSASLWSPASASRVLQPWGSFVGEVRLGGSPQEEGRGEAVSEREALDGTSY